MVDWAGVADGLFTIALIFGSILFAGGFSALAFFLTKEWDKYRQFKCIIWHRDGFGQLCAKRDTAGIFLHKKTNTKRLFIKKARVGLPPDNLCYIRTGKDKVIYLWQCGLKNFRFIKPNIQDNNISFTVGEEDVNWGINSYEASKKAFYNSKWAEYAPMIMFVIAVIAITVMIIFVLKKFDAIAQAAAVFKDATKNLAVAKASVV